MTEAGSPGAAQSLPSEDPPGSDRVTGGSASGKDGRPTGGSASGKKTKRRTSWSWPKRGLAGALALVLVAIAGVSGLNLWVVLSAKSRIKPVQAVGPGFDCILVLGAGIVGSQPSVMLAQRLDTAAELYFQGSAPVILVSGDNSSLDYSEVDVMRQYLVGIGIEEGDVYRDHAGFSTYETMVRAHQVFGVERAVVVTQRYHLSRALLDARGAGIDAVGVAAPGRPEGQFGRDLREVLARVKDPFMVWTKAKPTFLGPRIDLVPGQSPS
ncbi:MAG: YdcF family protein [Micrococcales bacterium]|nr:YdcF family protein [Micrococcales bacterium]